VDLRRLALQQSQRLQQPVLVDLRERLQQPLDQRGLPIQQREWLQQPLDQRRLPMQQSQRLQQTPQRMHNFRGATPPPSRDDRRQRRKRRQPAARRGCQAKLDHLRKGPSRGGRRRGGSERRGFATPARHIEIGRRFPRLSGSAAHLVSGRRPTRLQRKRRQSAGTSGGPGRDRRVAELQQPGRSPPCMERRGRRPWCWRERTTRRRPSTRIGQS
jgi:hypothetical protein